MTLNIKETFPLTHEQAVKTLTEADWSIEEVEVLLKFSPVDLHNGVGAILRESWYLQEISFPLNRHYRRRFGLGHADDMCRLILAEFLATLRKESFVLKQEAEMLRDHWLNQGMDPLTLSRIA
jgi:hypothetical protein